MIIIFLLYFILITSLSCFRKHKLSMLILVPAAIHIYWIHSKIPFTIFPLTGAILTIFIYSLSIFLIYWYQFLKEEDLQNIKIVYQNEENKLKQLSAQEKKLHKRNIQLERILNETVTIYEYVKKLGSTLNFDEVIIVFHNTLKSLIKFNKGKIILIENKNVSRLYNIYYDLKDHQEVQSKELRKFEKDLVDKILENPQNILYKKDKLSSLGQLPADINNLLAIPLVVKEQLVSILILDNLLLLNIDKIQFIAMQFALEVNKTQLYKKLKKLSIIDSLTGLCLRRHFQELLVNELDRCSRQKQPLSFLMIDIDWFKRYNDEYGHLVGDRVLKMIGSIFKQKSRENDLLCRYGGDEFALALPLTGSKEAQVVAERLRRGVNEYLFLVAKEEFQVSISIGVCTCLPENMQNSSNTSVKLIDTADKAMYYAKSQGRNKVAVSP